MTFESNEQFDWLLLGECEPAPRPDACIDGDGGVSMIVVVVDDGASAMGPTRRATFGGGLKLIPKKIMNK